MTSQTEHYAIPLLPHQHALVASSAPIVGIVGGFGSGKTRGLVAKAVELTAINYPAPTLFTEPTYRMVMDVAYRGFCDFFAEHDLDFEWRKSDYTFRVDIGEKGPGEILLRSADRPEALVGVNVGAALLDEAALVKEAVGRSLLSRIRHPAAAKRQLVLGGTPDGGMDSWFAQWLQFDAQEGTELIRASSDDNPYLPAGYVETMCAHMSPEEQDAYRRGLFVPFGGRVYHRFQRERHLAKCINPTAGQVQVWADFNVGMMAWCLVRVLNGEAHVFRDVIAENTDTQQHAEKTADVLAEYGIRPEQVAVYCDASGRQRRSSASDTDIGILRRAGFRVKANPMNPRIKDRVASVNAKLHAGALLFDPAATYALKCIEQQGRDAHGDPDKASGLDHGADAIGYGVHTQWPTAAPQANATHYH